jgi:predicted Zn-dependent protease
MTHAVSYWKRLGYKFGPVIVDTSPSCMNAYRGEILITLPEAGFDSSQMASTRVSRRPTNNTIVKAKIFIMPRNARKSRVLEHELGHALGWTHYNQKFHMMHPNWFLGGYDSRGLRNDG